MPEILRPENRDSRQPQDQGNKVIRRTTLAISPGDVLFNMVQSSHRLVKISKQRLEGLQYFDKCDTRPEPTDPAFPAAKI